MSKEEDGFKYISAAYMGEHGTDSNKMLLEITHQLKRIADSLERRETTISCDPSNVMEI